MILVKTNIAGFKKDTKTNTLLMVDTNKIDMVQEQRKRHRKQQGLELRLVHLEQRINNIEEKLQLLRI